MAGERSGKSFTGALYGVAKDRQAWIETPDRKRLIWVVGKEYAATVPEFLGGGDSPGMLQFLKQLGILRDEDISVRDGGHQYSYLKTTDGLTVETVSAEEPHKLRAVAPDGIVACEVGTWTEVMFQRAIGRLAERRGWLWASGSFETATGWLPSLHQRWSGDNDEDGHSYSVPSHSNLIIFPGGEADPEIMRQRAMMPEYLFKQRFLGIPALPHGVVFSEFLPATHVSSAAVYDPDLPVQVFIDPGYNTAYAVLVVQFHRSTVDIVDEVYEQDKTAEAVISICMKRPWWPALRRGVIDIAGTQHQGLSSHEEIWRASGKRLVSRKIKVEDSIARLRSVLRATPGGKTPMLRINPRCKGLISEMGGGPSPFAGRGPWTYKTDREGNIISDVPDDNNNDACKALAYGLIDNLGFVERPVRVPGEALWTAARGPSWMSWEGTDVGARKEPRVIRCPKCDGTNHLSPDGSGCAAFAEGLPW